MDSKQQKIKDNRQELDLLVFVCSFAVVAAATTVT